MKLQNLMVLGGVFASILAAAPANNDHVSGRLLVQARIGAKASDVATALLRAGGHPEKLISRLGVYVLQAPDAALDQISAALMQTELFTFVEQDHVLRTAAVIPNDLYFASEWHLNAIQAPSAWSLTTGTASVPIAIIDSGADWNHPDLIPNLMTGWNFITGTSGTQDSDGHGTAVSGTAAARRNNLMGVAGVSWHNKIMPLQVSSPSTAATYSAVADAITYAADHGVRIISISLCGSSASSTLQTAIDYAWSKGSVVFGAAGNSSSSAPCYPAAANNAVAVSATDVGGIFASFSNYGSYIDLSAPGNNILTTMLGGSYGGWHGTSFSTPIAAPVGALGL